MSKLEQAFELFDNYNRQSPDKIISDGKEYPAEYFYALMLHKWVKKLDPNCGAVILKVALDI
jgi:hypothetical protein